MRILRDITNITQKRMTSAKVLQVRRQRYTGVKFHNFLLKRNLRSHGRLIFNNSPTD